jgi:hypothetical protein
MIDFDQGGSGAAAADIGSLLGTFPDISVLHQRLLSTVWGGSDGVQHCSSTAQQSRVAWYTAAALVAERAIRAVNRVNRPVLAKLPELLGIADAVLAGKLNADG